MRLTSLWLVHGVIDGRAQKDVRLIADGFEEAAQRAEEALLYGWGVTNVPAVEVVSVELLSQEVRVDG